MEGQEHESRRCDNVLFIRHLPSCLKPSEKEDLLKYFGAKEVRIMSNAGRLKNTAFATFDNASKAKTAIARLHQVEILNCVLSVEYARAANLASAEKEKHAHDDSNKINTDGNASDVKEIVGPTKTMTEILPPVAPHYGLKYPGNPGLMYKYPSPNPDILINICSALLTVPKLYTQVLHLMNKMNLVPPFSPAASVPPMLVDHIQILCGLSFSAEDRHSGAPSDAVSKEPDNRDIIQMSESESEYETDDEQDGMTAKNMVDRDNPVPERVIKARKGRSNTVLRKDLKGKLFQELPAESSKSVSDRAELKVAIGEVFDENLVLAKKNIDIKAPVIIESLSHSTTLAEDSAVTTADTGGPAGFGRFAPAKDNCDDTKVAGKSEEESVLKDYITMKQLDAGRLSSKEIARSSLYKNYQRGEPTSRLYVKNLSKRATEKDLEFVFGRFVNLEDETEKNMFDVRLMTKGRMKGQAFVGLPSIESATRALKATNGYQLIDKPMVVQFARSSKPK